MKLHRIRGGNQTDLESKQYNICIGISLGNKWFSTSNIVELVRWALQYTREYVVVCSADEIHAINLEVRTRKGREKSIKIAKSLGARVIQSIKDEVDKSFSEEDKKKIRYATWGDVVNGPYRQKVDYLYQEYETNQAFREAIQGLVRSHVAGEQRSFSPEDIYKFGTYIIEELPELSLRVPIDGVVYDAYAYPFDGELTKFIEKFQKGEVFPEIRKQIMDTNPKVFFEVR